MKYLRAEYLSPDSGTIAYPRRKYTTQTTNITSDRVSLICVRKKKWFKCDQIPVDCKKRKNQYAKNVLTLRVETAFWGIKYVVTQPYNHKVQK